MSEHNDTQEIQLLKTAFTNFTIKMDGVVTGMKDMYTLHKEDIDEFKKEMRKEMYGSDDSNIGIKAKVTSIVIDRAKEKQEKEKQERNGFIWRTLIATPVVGLIIDWFVKLIHK